ncbi:MAG: hypothetical protein P8P15_07290 [Polaribacter sp.]|nr:hypothetical protein [Polaribacter sp.]MDG1227762.1 hypothetical protein [Polaribacter sp.]
MKKVIFTLLVMCISVTAIAQNKKAVKSAKNTTTKMTTELSLTKDEAKKVYDIMLAKFTRNIEIKKDNKGDKASAKKEIKQSNKNATKELALILGNERATKWKSYLAANKKKKNK